MGWVIPDDKVGHIYLASFYLCFTTITSVGYGDIYPINNSERAVAVRWGIILNHNVAWRPTY